MSNPAIAACFYAAIIFCGHRDGGFHYLPGANSFQYDDRHSLLSYSRSSIIKLRGGGEDSDGIDLQTTSQLLSPLQIDASIPAALDIPSDYANIGEERPPSKGLWKRITLIRGGVDGESREDDSDKAKGKEIEPTTNLEAKSNETGATSNDEHVNPPASRELDCKNNSSNLHNAGGNEGETKQTNSSKEGVFSSFFALFRGPTDSGGPIEALAANTTGIAHKMPHGPDGRGGGSAAFTTLPPPSVEEEDKEEEFVITTEVTEVAIKDTSVDTVEPAKSTSSVSESKVKPAVGTRRDSAAFVVPPAHKSLSSINNNKEENSKKSKASKGKTVETVDEAKTANATLIIKQNETHTITASASNDTSLDSNATLSTSNSSSVAEETSIDIEMRQQDYTSSGYVSFYLSCLCL